MQNKFITLFKQLLTANAYALPMPSDAPVTTKREEAKIKMFKFSHLLVSAAVYNSTLGALLLPTELLLTVLPALPEGRWVPVSESRIAENPESAFYRNLLREPSLLGSRIVWGNPEFILSFCCHKESVRNGVSFPVGDCKCWSRCILHRKRVITPRVGVFHFRVI